MFDSFKAFDKFLEVPTQFDMVIIEQTMPSLTGSMLARKAKSLSEDIPVIVSSGLNSGIEHGADSDCFYEFVTKPDEMKELIATVVTYITNAHSKANKQQQ